MRVFWKPFRASVLVLSFVFLFVGQGRAGADSGVDPEAAAAVVERLHDTLIDVMKQSDELGYSGRRDQLAPVLTETFDIQFMAQKSVGRHWKTVNDEDRVRLLETFERLTVANYAGRFHGYSGHAFETLKVEPSTHGTMVVHSQLVEPDGDTTHLNYRLRPTADGWKIIDVYLNGTISELALRRSEYSSMIQREGLPALITALDDRIEDLASGTADPTQPASL